jgi:hypothetical protein
LQKPLSRKRKKGNKMTEFMKKQIELATASVMQVGDGRGFLVEVANKYFDYPRRRIVTAAHCLPEMPPPHRAMNLNEKTYPDLLGPLGEKPTVWAECLFADPLSDLAVLGPPDGEELYDQCEAYEELVESLFPLPIAETEREGEAFLLSLDNRWFSARYERINWGPLCLSKLEQRIERGMSGSPVLDASGAAIGVVNLGEIILGKEGPLYDQYGSQTPLYRNLPGWMLSL